MCVSHGQIPFYSLKSIENFLGNVTTAKSAYSFVFVFCFFKGKQAKKLQLLNSAEVQLHHSGLQTENVEKPVTQDLEKYPTAKTNREREMVAQTDLQHCFCFNFSW